MQGVRTIHDLDARLRMMDEFEDYSQVLSLGLPPIEGMAGPDQAPEFARVANDGLAELCAKYPDRFAGYVGALPMSAPDAAVRRPSASCSTATPMGCSFIPTSTATASTSRASFRSSRSPPRRASRCCCIPARTANVPGLRRPRPNRNTRSGPILGWPYETSATMARLIFSGVTTRLPNLKVLVHHLGAMIPFFDARLDTGWATLGSRTSDEDYSGVLKMLGKPLMDCFRDFYADTRCAAAASARCAGSNSTAPITCCCLRRAVRRRGRRELYPRDHEGASASLDISAADKEKICYRNAQALFKLHGVLYLTLIAIG